ncbi:MAG: hypothetical protein LBH49_01695 [Puniceicoccales bacterium]|jgi:hypothetical protein|nr:hypothetical protein [Puniceicoccales bacterium]
MKSGFYMSGVMFGFCTVFTSAITLQSKLISPYKSTTVYTNQMVGAVNSKAITSRQIGIQLAEETNGKYNYDSPMIDKIGHNILQHTIDVELLSKEFEKMKGKAPENFKDKKFDQILKKNFNNDRIGFSNYRHTTGRSIRTFKDDLQKNEISSFMLHQRIVYHFEISPLQIKEFYDANYKDFWKDSELDISQIAILPKKNCQDIDDMINDIFNGFSKKENQDVIIKKYSDKCDVKITPLGKVLLKDIVEELRKEANTISEGMVTKPIKIKEYYLMVRVNKRLSEAYQLTLQEASNDIEKRISKKLNEEIYDKLISNLRSRYYNKIFI